MKQLETKQVQLALATASMIADRVLCSILGEDHPAIGFSHRYSRCIHKAFGCEVVNVKNKAIVSLIKKKYDETMDYANEEMISDMESLVNKISKLKSDKAKKKKSVKK
jgi:hypothetical protein